MARTRSTVEADATTEQTTQQDTGFGAEFRELARQRRFVRDTDDAGSDWRESAAPPRRATSPATPAPTYVPAPTPAAPTPVAAPVATPPAPSRRVPAPITRTAAPLPGSPSLRRAAVDPRISDDQRATLRELARMSDRLVDSREQLATANSHVQHLEGALVDARDAVRAGEQRVMASRVLVQDAQRATREIAERCSWLEARCETLQEALELAVNASWSTRWKWRRERRARDRARTVTD